MAAPTNLDTELLTEHFGYPPVSLLDDIINSVNILAEKALDSVEKALLSQPPASLGFRPPAIPSTKSKIKDNNAAAAPPALLPEEAHSLEVENGTHQLETLLCASIDRNFDKFELYVMRNILVVRPEDRDWVRLAHYDGLDLTTGPTDDVLSPTSINALRRRLQASQRLNVALHAERARGAALLRELRSVVGGGGDAIQTAPAPLAFLRDTGALAGGDAHTPLGTTTAFALSQLQALRALSTSLRHVMPDLADGGGGAGDGDGEESATGERKGWRRERLEYVEGATRKHLENVRGLELGKNGEVRDGEWQGEGRQLAKGEAIGMEHVVTILGSGPDYAGRVDEMDDS